VVGKELALVLLVPGNAVVLQQGDEVLRREPRQRRAAELRVLADEVLVRRARIEIAIGEVAAPAARDADFFGHLVGVVDQQHAQPALASLAGAEQAGGAGTDHDDARTRWSGPGQLRGRPAAREQRSVDICGRPG